MRKWFFYLILIISGVSFQGNKPQITKWVITSGCSLKVEGSTNINRFSCEIINYSKPDTVIITRLPNLPVYLSGSIRLDVQNFNCHNPVMTADLRKTLKVKEFPKLSIRFISLSKYPDAASRHSTTKGIVMIELAGVSRPYEVDYKIVSSDNNFINLVGTRRVSFSEFNLIPPRKLGGMIKTNNELTVEFNVRFKVLN